MSLLQLKRILSSYPHFVKGYLLLSLLYLDSGNQDKAKKALKRVLRIDKNNTLAIKYLSEIGSSPQEIINIREQSKKIDLNAAYSDEDIDQSDLETFVHKGLERLDNPDLSVGSFQEINHNKFSLIYVSVGLILATFVFWILILPTKLNSVNQESRKQQLAYSEEISRKNSSITDLKDQISDLERSVARQEQEDKKAKDKEKDDQDAFDIVKDSIPNTTYEALCREAEKALSAHEYGKAIDMCNVALQIQEGEEAYYNLGKAYIGNQDEEKARSAFISIKENYPSSDYLDEINDYLEE